MAKTLSKLGILISLLLVLPLAGILLQGRHPGPYLEFPPRSQHIAHLDFSWPAFLIMGMGILLWSILVVVVLIRLWWPHRHASSPAQAAFPRWGWAGLIAGLLIWFLAWQRFPWMAWFQPHTFAPLWLCYIVVINAATWQRTGRCMLTHRPRYLLKLFFFSAAFWWCFEYLNRFVQNWYYREAVSYSAIGYLLAASVAFSTVLPAVLSTRDWLLSFRVTHQAFADSWRLELPAPRLFATIGLLLGCLLLMGIGMVPNLLFPLLWLAPLLIIISLQTLYGDPHLFSHLALGDWRPVITAAIAACICGFFWEMWNYRSLAKWFYEIPLVHRYELFEMPILGYAGYFPFGWECAAAEDLIHETDTSLTI